jgi:hypothetical protein
MHQGHRDIRPVTFLLRIRRLNIEIGTGLIFHHSLEPELLVRMKLTNVEIVLIADYNVIMCLTYILHIL